MPGSCCGVVGFKPSYGRVPELPPFNLDHWCHEGPMARTGGDCALLFSVMAGPDPSDVASLRPKLHVPSRLGGIEGWRIAVCADLGDYDVDEDVVANTIEAANALGEAGAIVEEVQLGWNRLRRPVSAWAERRCEMVMRAMNRPGQGTLIPFTDSYVRCYKQIDVTRHHRAEGGRW